MWKRTLTMVMTLVAAATVVGAQGTGRPASPAGSAETQLGKNGKWIESDAEKAYEKANGVEVLGVTDHGMFHSIYFFDPNGHRVELACPDPEEAAMIAKADAVKWQMLEEWSRTKRAPRQGAFLHEREFNPGAAS